VVGSDETPGAVSIETTEAEHRTERWSAAGLWDPKAPDAQVRGAQKSGSARRIPWGKGRRRLHRSRARRPVRSTLKARVTRRRLR